MGILRKPYEELNHYIYSGTPAAASGILTVGGFPPIPVKDILKVGSVVSATAGVAQVITLQGVDTPGGNTADPSSIFGISLGGFREGAMPVRTQTVQIRQDDGGSLTDVQLNDALVSAINAKFGRFVIAARVTTTIVVTSRLNGPSFSAGPFYTDNTSVTALVFGDIVSGVAGVYPSGQLLNANEASQPRQLRDIFPHLTEITPPIITTALAKIDVELIDRNVNGGDGSGRKKVVSFYGTALQVGAIASTIALSGSNAQL